jgi:hypothetical protein
VDEAAQQRLMNSALTQRTLQSMSEEPAPRQEPMRALMNQCYRAWSGQDDGMNFMTVKF